MKTFFDGIETGMVMTFALTLGMFTRFVQLALGVVVLVVPTFFMIAILLVFTIFVLTAFLLFTLLVFASLLMISLFVTFVVGGLASFLKLFFHLGKFGLSLFFGQVASFDTFFEASFDGFEIRFVAFLFGVALYLHHFFHLGEFGLGFLLGDVAAFDGAFDTFFDVLEVAFFSLWLIAFLAVLLSDCGQGQKGDSCQDKDSGFHDFLRLFDFFDPKVTELVGLTFLAVVLNANDAAGVLVVRDVGGHDAVDFDFDVIAFASDAVGVPVVAFEGFSSAPEEGCDTFLVAFFRADEPLAPTLVVETAGPITGTAIHL